MTNMKTFSQFYEKYASVTASMKKEEVENILSPYAQLFNIKFEDGSIILANHDNPLNTIAINRIKAIVEQEDALYIVLPNSIYALDKSCGEIELNIR